MQVCNLYLEAVDKYSPPKKGQPKLPFLILKHCNQNAVIKANDQSRCGLPANRLSLDYQQAGIWQQ